MTFGKLIQQAQKLEEEQKEFLSLIGASSLSRAKQKWDAAIERAFKEAEDYKNRLREVCEAAGETNLNQLNAVRAIEALKKEKAKTAEAVAVPEEFHRIPKHFRYGSKRVPATRLKMAMNRTHEAIKAVLSQVPEEHHDELKRDLVRLWGNPNVPFDAFINGAYDAMDKVLDHAAAFAEKDYSADFLRTAPLISLLGEAVSEELADLCDWSPIATATFASDWEPQSNGAIPALWFVFKTFIRATDDPDISRFTDLFYETEPARLHSLLAEEGLDAALDAVSAFIRPMCEQTLHSEWEETAIRDCRIPIAV